LAEYLSAASGWVFLAPIVIGLVATALYRQKKSVPMEPISEALRLFAFLWIGICILIWELQEIPEIDLRGLH
jgi:hypothetical protein